MVRSRAVTAAVSYAIACVASVEAIDINLPASDLKVQGEGWTYYNMHDSPEGGYMGWLKAGVAMRDGTVLLPRSLPVGTYSCFAKCINYGNGVNFQVLGGDRASTLICPTHRDWNGRWTQRVTLTAGRPTREITVRLKKIGDLARPRKLLLTGLYLTDSPSVIVDRYDTVIDLTYPAALDDSVSVKRNLIPNGSFEVGLGHGWGFVGGNRDYSIRTLWNRTEAHYGQASLKLPPRGRLVSRVIRVAPNRRHTLSLWAKPVGSSASLEAHLCSVHYVPKGFRRPIYLKNTFALKPGWQRVSLSGHLRTYPNDEYQVKVLTKDATVRIDGLQLEEGDLGEYRSMAPLEIGLMCDKVSNIFFEDEPCVMQLLLHNSARRDAKAKVRYAIYDYRNREVKTDALSAGVPAQATQQIDLNVSTGKRGIFRVVMWVDGMDRTEEEVVYSVVPRPRVRGRDRESMIGVHANASAFQYEALGRLGVKWQRVMSPTMWFRWKNIEPKPGEFIWYDDEVRKTVSHGFEIMGTIGTNDYWPAWADRGGKPDLDAWETAVRRIVAHYREWVKHWEIWNEPIYQFSPPFYADMLRRAARAIREEDPHAKIIGMGGSYRCSWCLDVIKHLGGNPRPYMDYLATHLYPAKSDPRNPLSARAARTFYDEIVRPFELEVWNTETGAWCLGFHKGRNSSFRSPGRALWPHRNAARYCRGANYQALRVARNFLHSIGNGLSRYFYYDSRFHASPDYYKSHPSILGFDDTIRAKGVAYAILAYLFDHSKGLGNVSPDESTFAYLFDRERTALAALWAADGRNKTMAIGLAPSSFTVSDMMGNPLSTSGSAIHYGAEPVYLEARGEASVADLRSAIQNATIAEAPDTTPPNLSISDAPRGSTNENSVRIRWIAIDETSFPQNSCPRAITYSYRLVGHDAEWSAWTPQTFKDYTGLPQGSFRFEVRARDEAGNVSSVAARGFRIAQTAPHVQNGAAWP